MDKIQNDAFEEVRLAGETKELTKQYTEVYSTLEKIKKDLVENMKKRNINRIDLPDGSYIRYWKQQIVEGIKVLRRTTDRID